MKVLKIIAVVLCSVLSLYSQSKISMTTHFGQFFTGYKDRSGDKYLAGLNYKFNERMKLSISHSFLTYREEYSFYIDDKVLFIDNDFTNFPLPKSVSEGYQKTETNFGSKKLKPGYYNHQYNMTNVEWKYNLLNNKFKLGIGLGFSIIKAQILERGTEFDSVVVPFFSGEEGIVRDVVPILIKYLDYGYCWSVNMGHKLTDRTIVQMTFTHSAYAKSAGPVSASIGPEVDL